MLRATLVAAACAIAGAHASTAVAQPTQVHGFVTDSATGAPLARVRVEWSPPASPSRATLTSYTDDGGRFTVALTPGSYGVLLRRVGYAPARLERVEVTGANFNLRIRLVALGVPVDPVVISASRSEQTQLDAPASTSVIGREAVAADLRFSPFEQIRELPGVDYAAKGLLQNTFEVRGPRAPTSGAMLMLTDSRYAELPSLGFNVSYLVPTTREDIDRIEVVRGPAAALYGPGAPRGVLHVITRSPFESPGGVASVTAGGRAVRQATVRYAGVIYPRVAMSVSADYFQGEDWTPGVDPAEIKSRDAAVKAGADPDTLRIGLRDPFIKRVGGEARLDWRPGAKTEVVTKSGIADAINLIDVTGAGAAQLRDWRSWYVQSKIQHGRLVANLVFNMNNAGDTYFLRSGLPVVEKSRLASAQLQHGAQRGGVDLVYGMDIRATDPRTEGTVHGHYEEDDFVVEAGAYGQATTTLGSRLQLVTALRADHHSTLEDLVLEPRIGIVYKAGRTHAVRLTYNHAYSSPPPVDLFRDTRGSSLPGLPYTLRTEARPRDGFTFRRDCNGLCMRSPFPSGEAGQYMPADATLLWAEMVALLGKRGVNIADVPAPGTANVSTILATFNQNTRAFDRVLPVDVRDLEPVRRQLTDVLELGYKGVLHGAAAASVDLYTTHVQHRTTAATNVTPSVLFDKGSLQQYLTQFRTSSDAAQIATVLAQIPVGTVTPTQSPYSADILLVGRQGQSYTIYGVDLSGELPLGARASAFATYSWASYDSLPGASDEPVNLTIPENKASLMLSYGRPAAPLKGSLRARAVGPFRSGVASGQRVPGYGVIDMSLTAQVPGTRASVSAEVQNLLDHAHYEFSGGAILRRIVMLRTRVEF